MAVYRLRSTGELKSQGQVRKLNPNVSAPKIWDASICDSLNVDEVHSKDKPEASGPFKIVKLDGAVLEGDKWVQNWVEEDMFVTDEDGSKAEKEAEYQAQLDDNAAGSVRARRNELLAETDFHALSDVTMTPEMEAYRQALRDITSHANFPYLEDSDYPTKP
jgi:hypothetical protein